MAVSMCVCVCVCVHVWMCVPAVPCDSLDELEIYNAGFYSKPQP